MVQTRAARFTFTVVHAARTVTAAAAARAYPRGRRPASEFVNGLPEARTGSAQEYFQVDPAHYSSADGPVIQKFRVDHGAWQAMPQRRVFYTGTLRPGRHRVTVLTADRGRAEQAQLQVAGGQAARAAVAAAAPAGTRRT